MSKMTDFQICHLDTLLYQYGMAPMTGEIFGGGVQGVLDSVSTAFALLGDHYWQFDRLRNSYAARKWKSKYHEPSVLEARLNKFMRPNGMNDIRSLTTDLLRHLQMGLALQISNELKRQVLEFIEEKRCEIIRRFQANHAVAQFFRYEGKSWDDFENAAEFLYGFWKDLPLNYLEMTYEQQRDLCSSLNYPSQVKFVQRESNVEGFRNAYKLDTALMYPDRSDYIADLMEQPADAKINLDYAREKISDAILKMNRACALLSDILNGQHNVIDFSKDNRWVSSPFPVFLVATNEACFRKTKYEYRSERSLKFGDDIQAVAVPYENMIEVRDFFESQGIILKVMSVDDLSKAAANKSLASQMTLGFLSSSNSSLSVRAQVNENGYRSMP